MAASGFGNSGNLGRYPISMLESFPVALGISVILGFLAGLGVGGGSLLVMWLTLIVGIDHPQARIINLMFFIPAAIISSLFRWKQGSLDFKKVIPAIIAGCLAAAAFSWLARYLELDILKKIFGGLLLIAGLRELLYKTKKQAE